MNTALFLLSGALQSWGTTSIGHTRNTLVHPTKSGVIGMIASAQGRERADDISDIAGLRFGVRIENPGTIVRDYHTVRILTVPTKMEFDDRTTERFYLADASFLVAVSSPDKSLIDSVCEAMNKPLRPLFLGRKSCVPTSKIFHGRTELSVSESLKSAEWAAPQHIIDSYAFPSVELDIFRETEGFDETMFADTEHDQPISFAEDRRRYQTRLTVSDSAIVTTGYVAAMECETQHSVKPVQPKALSFASRFVEGK